MEKLKKIQIPLLVFLVLCIVLFFGTRSCVNSKDERLKAEATENFEKFFAEQNTFVSPDYSEQKVTYKATPLSEYYAIANKEENFSRWVDMYELYEVTPNPNAENKEYGWSLTLVKKLDSEEKGIKVFRVHPHLVGFKRDDYSRFRPHSVQGAVDKFYKFFTIDDKSPHSEFMKDDLSFEGVNEAISNAYYELISTGELEGTASNIRYEFAQDSDYIVVNSISPVAQYKLQYKESENPKGKNLRTRLILGYLLLVLLLAGSVFGLDFLKHKVKEKKEETFKDKLLRLCNPTQFMKPYDEKKVALANDLYAKITSTGDEDFDKLRLLRKEAETTLGINFFDKKLLKELLKQSNPKNYMEPYDPEKVKIANQLHTKLRNAKLSVDELEDIQKEIQEKLL